MRARAIRLSTYARGQTLTERTRAARRFASRNVIQHPAPERQGLGWGVNENEMGGKDLLADDWLGGAFGSRSGAECAAAEAASAHWRRKRLPARSGIACHGDHRTARPGKRLVDHDHPHRYRSADQEEARIQCQEPERL